jgi:DegV family protein with EDD domain
MDMDTLKRGGRISAASAFFAKTLNINPVLHVSNEGKLVARTKKIGRRGALRALLDKFLQTYIKEENDTVFISHSSCLEEAQSLAESIKENTDIKEILINDVGPVIGGHCGVGTIALFFVAAER